LKNLAQACIREISFYEFDKLAIAPGPIRQAPPSTGSFVEFVALGQQRIYPYEIRIAVDRDRRRAAQCNALVQTAVTLKSSRSVYRTTTSPMWSRYRGSAKGLLMLVIFSRRIDGFCSVSGGVADVLVLVARTS